MADSNDRAVADAVKKFIAKSFLFTDDASVVKETDSLMQQGTMDSTGVLEVVNYLEDTYKIKVADEEMVPDNLDSVEAIVAFVRRKRAA